MSNREVESNTIWISIQSFKGCWIRITVKANERELEMQLKK